jgi:heptosyltransferase-3
VVIALVAALLSIQSKVCRGDLMASRVRAYAPTAQKAKRKRVLLYRLGSLGDMTVALPAFHLVARAFPDAERRLLTSFPPHAKAPAASAILNNTGLVHGYIRYSYGTRNVVELLKLWWSILRFKPDLFIYMSGRTNVATTRRNVLFFKICAVRSFVGVPLTPDMHEWKIIGPGEMRESESERLLRNLAPLGASDLKSPASWDLCLTASEKEAARMALDTLAGKPLIVCGPGTKMQAKDWGQENWQALIRTLSARFPGVGLAMIGAKEDGEVSEFAATPWAGPKVNLCGKLTPRESAAVFAISRDTHCVFLGPDSGPMHLAASAGVPCVICFSARGLPGVWFPAGDNHKVIYHQVNCFGCNLETCIVEGRKCLSSITIGEMVTAVESVFLHS